MIRNILFDMGNVLIRFDRDFFITRLGVTEEDKELLMREVFHSVEWVQMDRGSIAEPEAVERICKRLPPHLHDAAEKLVAMWDRPILPIDGMYELVEELKKAGVHTYAAHLDGKNSYTQENYCGKTAFLIGNEGNGLKEETAKAADIIMTRKTINFFRTL